MMQSPVSIAEIKLTLLAAGVPYIELDISIEWAFGSIDTPIKSWVESWNDNHKEIFEMKGSDSVFDSIYKIGEAYANKENCNK
jgi:hypothetical protein